MTRWVWDGTKWNADGPRNTPTPTFPGGLVGSVFRDEPTDPDPYAAAETLVDGTVIDYPALVSVMDTVELGVQVPASQWRLMREHLSKAITLKNKSHPAHGTNFDKPQRPEQQIVDWANVISGELKEKLSTFFQAKYQIYLK
jgi:hypothetical protein